jgi:hypothetical protein
LSLVYEFLSSRTEKDLKYYSENSSVAASDFIAWAKKAGYIFKKVKGIFLTDIPVFSKKDFTKQMKSEMLKEGLDFKSDEDRALFIETRYKDKFKRNEHYWCVSNGVISDPSGELKFIQTDLATDLNPERYV